MRSAINTCLTILFLLIILFSSVSFAGVCTTGDKPVIKFSLGSNYAHSVCIDGCRAEEGYNGQSTWVCSDELGYCTGYYVTTGDTCEGQDDTDGSCSSDGQCEETPSTGTPDPDDNKARLPNAPSVGSAIINRNGITDLSNPLQIAVNSSRTSAKYIERAILNQTDSLYSIGRESNNLQKAGVRQIKDDLGEVRDHLISISRTNQTIKDASINSRDYINQSISQDKEFYDYLKSAFGNPNDFGTRPKSLFEALGHIRSNNFNINATLNSIFGEVSSMTDPLQNLNPINARISNIQKLLEDFKSSGGSSGDTSKILQSINGISSDLKSIEGVFNNLNSPEYNSLIDFGAETLYSQSDIDEINKEIEDLKLQLNEKIGQFKKLFAFDSSQLSNGQYDDHSIDFTVNGQGYNFKSGIWGPFIDISPVLYSVILFVAVLIGLRMIFGGGRN